jgi:hypothetical protein
MIQVLTLCSVDSTIDKNEKYELARLEAEIKECRKHRDALRNLGPTQVTGQDSDSLAYWERELGEMTALGPKLKRFFQGLRDKLAKTAAAKKANSQPKKVVKGEEGRGGAGDYGAGQGRGMGGRLDPKRGSAGGGGGGAGVEGRRR